MKDKLWVCGVNTRVLIRDKICANLFWIFMQGILLLSLMSGLRIEWRSLNDKFNFNREKLNVWRVLKLNKWLELKQVRQHLHKLTNFEILNSISNLLSHKTKNHLIFNNLIKKISSSHNNICSRSFCVCWRQPRFFFSFTSRTI